MKILNIVIQVFCLLVILVIGCILLALGLHLKGMYDLSFIFYSIQNIPNMWLISGLSGLVMILLGLSAAQGALAKFQREKTIAFNNPDGQVTISLMAIEDFIKRTARGVPEIKDIRSNVVASKKGVLINIRVSFYSDVNIPDTTERIQSLIKNEVQEMLGIEEAITVKIHVAKIVAVSDEKKEKEESQEETEPMKNRPFQYSVKTKR